MSLDQRAAAWREKYPQKADALRKAIVGHYGMRGRGGSNFALRVVEPLEVAILTALLGWGTEPKEAK